GLFSSHPPSQQRVEANRATAKTLPESGEVGVQRYKDKIARLIRTKDDYHAFDMGTKALTEGKTAEALSLAQQAILGEPNEGQFHALVGDVYMKQQQYQDALASYNKAVDLNSEFFYFYVQRGLNKQQLGDQQGARTDLERSTELLPTAPALNALGNMSLAQGNRLEAMQYFKDASVSNSEPGRQAALSFVKLDMHGNPGSHIKTHVSLDDKRYVIVTVTNPTPIPVSGVKVKILYPDPHGKALEMVKEVSDILSSGKSTIVETEIGPVDGPKALRYMRANVLKANVVE
ncbi:MAG: tetratricopeptide repeat protein, partial [Candidatus Brocadiales bacterium]|nr:tetratricopeptide repeat protein [Candidatus Brocadiales bacterium]